MEQEIIVLFARPYEFTDEKTGRVLKGVTVYYLNQNPTNSEKDGFGLIPTKVSLDNANDLKHIPGKYKAIFTMTPSAKGMSVRLSALEFNEKVDIWAKDQIKEQSKKL